MQTCQKCQIKKHKTEIKLLNWNRHGKFRTKQNRKWQRSVIVYSKLEALNGNKTF